MKTRAMALALMAACGLAGAGQRAEAALIRINGGALGASNDGLYVDAVADTYRHTIRGYLQVIDPFLPPPGVTPNVTLTTFDETFNPSDQGFFVYSQTLLSGYLSLTSFDNQATYSYGSFQILDGNIGVSVSSYVPLPKTLSLFGLAMIALGIFGHRRSKTNAEAT